jgi:DNA-binding NtrC family response regulator
VVDDQKEVRDLLTAELSELGLEVHEAADGVHGWDGFCEHRPDLVISDFSMPRANGIELLRRIRGESRTPVLILSACGDIRTAVTAVQAGAHDFLTFPDDVDRLIRRVKTLLGSEAGGLSLGAELEERIIGHSPAMQKVRSHVAGLGPLGNLPVVVCGESGVGRSHIVDALHALSPHAGQELIRVDCGGGRPLARLDAGRGAPIYFDDLSSLSPEDQSFVASLVEAQSVDIGRSVPRFYASVVDDSRRGPGLERLVPALRATFARFPVHIVPLRDRPGDVTQLVAYFCRQIGARLGRPDVRVSGAGIARLKQYSWPGNLRELSELMERLIAFTPKRMISRRQIGDALGQESSTVANARIQRDRERRQELEMLLDETGGNLAEVARRLDLSRGAIHYRAQKFGLLTNRDK